MIKGMMKHKIFLLIVLFALTGCVQEKKADRIDNPRIVPALVKVDIDTFPFEDMEYVSQVAQSKFHHPDDGAEILLKYAFLGGEWTTFDSGRECYLTINGLYLNEQEKSQVNILYDYKHIICFSNDGETVLVKNYADPASQAGGSVLYEVYDGLNLTGSYYFGDILRIEHGNYTKGLKYVNLNRTLEGVATNYLEEGETDDFYRSSQLSHSQIDSSDVDMHEISRVTDPTDTIYYKKDIDKEGNECIGIYSIDSHELIYQSKAIEQGIKIEEKLNTVMLLLNNKVIIGVHASELNRERFMADNHGYDGIELDYYEIDIKSGEWNYLFTDIEGEFSPDGKFFVGHYFGDKSWELNSTSGYHMVCLETGEYTNLPTSIRTSETLHDILHSHFVCWVKKDKINELLSLAD